MVEIQHVLLNPIDWVALRSEGRCRHLCLLGHEGLFMIERWQAMRHWDTPPAYETEKDKYEDFS